MTVVFVEAFFPSIPLAQKERGVVHSIQHGFPGILKDQGLGRTRIAGNGACPAGPCILINNPFPDGELQSKRAPVGRDTKSIESIGNIFKPILKKSILMRRSLILIINCLGGGTKKYLWTPARIGHIGNSPVGFGMGWGNHLTPNRGWIREIAPVTNPAHPVAPRMPSPVMVIGVLVPGQLNLAHVALAFDLLCLGLGPSQGRQQQGGQDGDDGDYHQQFN